MRHVIGLPQLHDDPHRAIEAARQAESAGAWGVWAYDNLRPLRRPDAPSLDGWTLLTLAARATSRVRLVSLVTRAGLRPPALMARMAAVAQAASGGRFVLGLGVGDAAGREEERAFGIMAAASRDARLTEVERTIGEVRAPRLPVRPRSLPPPIWVGGTSEPVRDLAARHADAWHAWGIEPAEFAALAANVRARAGRPIECWWGGFYRPDRAGDIVARLREAACDGITWMVASARDAQWRPLLIDWVART